MKTLKFKPVQDMNDDGTFRWAEDVGRIIGVCYSKGYMISQYDAQAAWEQHSDDYAASWLILPTDNEQLFNIIIEQCKEEV